MTALIIIAAGLLALSTGLAVGAAALFGALGMAAALVGVGAGWVALGLLVDFDHLKGSRP